MAGDSITKTRSASKVSKECKENEGDDTNCGKCENSLNEKSTHDPSVVGFTWEIIYVQTLVTFKTDIASLYISAKLSIETKKYHILSS